MRKPHKNAAINAISRRKLVALGLTLSLSLGLGTIAASSVAVGDAHVLVMVEEAGCIYCQRWHAEVGPAYANSPEGRFAPLKRMMIGTPASAHIAALRYTPTFVLMRGDTEVGRITGYPGADFFWGLLADLLAKTSFSIPPREEIKT